MARADVTGRLASALADALVALARAGEADQACRLAAATWAELRTDSPELDARLTALLHRLVRIGSPADESRPLLGATAVGGRGGRPDRDPPLGSSLPPISHQRVVLEESRLKP